jgi:hypothetical protein
VNQRATFAHAQLLHARQQSAQHCCMFEAIAPLRFSLSSLVVYPTTRGPEKTAPVLHSVARPVASWHSGERGQQRLTAHTGCVHPRHHFFPLALFLLASPLLLSIPPEDLRVRSWFCAPLPVRSPVGTARAWHRAHPRRPAGPWVNRFPASLHRAVSEKARPQESGERPAGALL